MSADMSQREDEVYRGEEDTEGLEVRDESQTNPVSQKQLRWKNAMPQILASCVAHSIMIQMGVNLAYSAVLLPQLAEPGSVPTATKVQSSWIVNVTIIWSTFWILASLVPIGTLLGSLVTGLLMDRLGRKTTCQLSCVPFVVAWTLVFLAKSVTVLYIGRLLAGFGGGLSTASLVYVLEVSHPRNRHMLLCLNSVFLSFGILLTCILAQWFTWRFMAIWFGILALSSFLALWLLPESPQWMVTYKQKKQKHVEAAVRWLNRCPEHYQQELTILMDSTEQRVLNQKDKGCGYRVMYSTVLKPATLKPIAILLFIFLFQQLSGGYIVIYYAVHIFQMVGGTSESGFDEYDALVLLGVVRFVMSIITATASRRFGRRLLSILSGLGMFISMLIVALYLHIQPIGNDDIFTNIKNNVEHLKTTEEEHWICVTCILLYVCFCSLGVLVIPWTLVGELLPMRIRGIGGSFVFGTAYILMFSVIKCFPFVLDVVESECIFYFFSFMSLTGVAFIYFFLPETFGKTLQEIEDHFK